jgi:hypothetical protein
VEVEKQTVCAGFEGPCPHQAKPSKGAFDPSRVAQRKGEPWRCRLCGVRKRSALLTPQAKSASSRKGHETKLAVMSPELREATIRKRKARAIQSSPEKDALMAKLFVDQGGLCALCDKPGKRYAGIRMVKGSKIPCDALVLDHCHISKIHRALLHDSCNKLLGMARENPELLFKAGNYAQACQDFRQEKARSA